MSKRSTRKLLAALVIAVAGMVLPAFPERIKELMETMNKARIVANIPADAETAEDILEKLLRGIRIKKKKRN